MRLECLTVRAVLRRAFIGPDVPSDARHARLAAIRQEMEHPDPFERPDFPADEVKADPERIRRQWQKEQALRACWRT